MTYLAAALALGVIALWGSEVCFWVVPVNVSPSGLFLTWLLYAAACASVLSALLWTGARGWPAAFLGGTLMGYLVEGAAVGTIYDAFPFQLVWTPLAWHGLVTGGAILALSRAPIAPGRRAALWVLLGLGLAFWAQFWGAERDTPLGAATIWVHLGGIAFATAAANLVLDRLGSVRKSRGLLIAPALFALSWTVQFALAPDPRRLVLPPIIALLVGLLHRLGRGRCDLSLSGPMHSWEHGLLLLAPATAIPLAAAWQVMGPPAPWANVAVALISGFLSLAILVRLALTRRHTRESSRASSF